MHTEHGLTLLQKKVSEMRLLSIRSGGFCSLRQLSTNSRQYLLAVVPNNNFKRMKYGEKKKIVYGCICYANLKALAAKEMNQFRYIFCLVPGS